MDWLAYVTIGLIVLGAVLFGIRYYQRTGSLIGALQAGAEHLIADMAKRGQVNQANAAGKIMASIVSNAGPAVAALNQVHFGRTKAKLKASGINIRAMIGEATRKARGDS